MSDKNKNKIDDHPDAVLLQRLSALVYASEDANFFTPARESYGFDDAGTWRIYRYQCCGSGARFTLVRERSPQAPHGPYYHGGAQSVEMEFLSTKYGMRLVEFKRTYSY